MPFFEHNNARIYYETAGDRGTPVLYINGGMSHSKSGNAQMMLNQLSPKHRVLVFDKRGCGQTKFEGETSIEDMATDVATLMDHLEMKDVHVVGNSIGGHVALALSLQHPEIVKSLVLVASAVRRNARNAFIWRTLLELREAGVPPEKLNRLLMIFTLSEEAFENEALINALLSSFKPDLYAPSIEQQKERGRALEAFRPTLYERLPMVQIPTLCMIATDDNLMLPRYQEEVAERIPDAEIKHYTGGHVFMNLPHKREQFFGDLEAFWQKHD